MSFAVDQAVGNRHIICQYKDSVSTFGMWLNRNPLNYALPLMILQLAAISFTSLFIELFLQPLGQSSIVAQIIVRFSFLFILIPISNMHKYILSKKNRAVLYLGLHYWATKGLWAQVCFLIEASSHLKH